MKLTHKFDIDRDQYQWILTTWYDGKDRDGNPKRQSKETYHATLSQVARHIIDKHSESVDTLDELVELYTMSTERLAKHLEENL